MSRIKTLRLPESWRFSTGIFLVVFIGLWGWMIFFRNFIPHDQASELISRPYLGVAPEENSLLEVWQRWDVLQYQTIAINGYSSEKLEPYGVIFPFLMRLGATFSGGSTLPAGLLISSLFCLAAMHAFYRLAIMEWGEKDLSRRALLYLILFPTAFFLFAPYSESLFLLGAILSIYNMRRKKWVAAGLWGMLAASVRLSAVLLVVPILYEAWLDWRQSGKLLVWISPLLTFCGAALFPLYIWFALKLPPWEVFTSLGSGFERRFTFPGINLLNAVNRIIDGVSPLVNVPDLIFMLFFIAGTVLVWKKLPLIYSIYTTTFMFLYLCTTTNNYPLMSISRYGLALFPIFMVLPKVVTQKKYVLLITAIFLAGLLFYSAQFAIWGWAG